MRHAFALLLSIATMLLSAPCAAVETATAAFDRLAALAGRWEGEVADGRRHAVEIRASAGGSVLVETWTLGPGRESITIYHRDGERLLATHYCLQGNAPRLAYVDTDADGRLQFAFVDGTGLQPADGWHQHAFWIQPTAEGFVRAETYVQNGTTTTDGDEPPVAYVRVSD